jgi:hypothetical protein
MGKEENLLRKRKENDLYLQIQIMLVDLDPQFNELRRVRKKMIHFL